MDLRARVGDALGSEPTAVEALEGGMVGSVHRVDLADGRTVVAKTGDTPLSVEAFMLEYLAARGLPVPDVLAASDDLLVLEYVDGTSRFGPAVERDAAAHLARLHDRSAEGFGFERDTLTGPLVQPNPWTGNWIDFYRAHRLLYMAAEAREAGELPAGLHDRLRSLADDLQTLLREPAAPSLIHGDVWRTNVLAGADTVRAFLDPACYYGHAEVELAYVDWTDTFGDPFFERYYTLRGLDDGAGFFDRRRYVYRLYPLCTHVRLFGDPYVEELSATLHRLGY